MQRIVTAFLLSFFLSPLQASNLPDALTLSQIDEVVGSIGFGASTRLLRAADSLQTWPGVEIGVEVLALPIRNFNQFGAGNGAVPGLIPIPRLYLAKGLFAGLEIVASAIPTAISDTVSTFGGLLKWTARSEDENWLAVAVYAGASHAEAFTAAGSFPGVKANSYELGALLSKDYVRLKPYFGGSFLLATGSVDPSIATTQNRANTQTGFRMFVGTEIELPINFAAQLDFINLLPTLSLFVGKRF